MFRFSHPHYTMQDLLDVLHARNGSQQIRYRYELLDKNLRRKFDLSNVTSGFIDYSSLADIKRIGSFTLVEDPSLDIDYLNDRLKVYMQVCMPREIVERAKSHFLMHAQPTVDIPTQEKVPEWVEFPMGVFYLSSPTREDKGNHHIERKIEAYDGLVVLINDKILDRLIIPAGTSYKDALINLLIGAGITKYIIEETSSSVPRDLEFEPGREKLYIINELARQINFNQGHFDEDGYFVLKRYVSPSDRSADYTYATDEESIIYVGASEELDLFDVPNSFIAIRTNAEEEPLISTFVNTNPNSPTSYPSRGFYIVDRRELQDIADQDALDAYVKRVAFEASQVYGRIKFRTTPMPFHGFMNVLDFKHDPLGIDGTFLELSWKLDLDPVNGHMEHELRKIVNVEEI